MANDKVDIFIPIYIGDYLGDTQDLNAEEHGAYLMILFTMWKTRSPVVFEKMASIARVRPEQWPDVWGTIKRFFDVSAGMVTQGRLMRELDASIDKKRRASDRGRKGGLARAQAQADCELDSSSTTVPEEPKPARLTLMDLGSGDQTPEQNPDPSRQSSARSESQANGLAPVRQRQPIARVGAATLPFLDCFNQYPRKDGRQEAAQAWQAIADTYPGGELGLAAAILARFKTGMLLKPPYFGPNGTRPFFETFLVNRRWEDPESAPDDVAAPRPAETQHQREERARREGLERRLAAKADVEAKERAAEAAIAARAATAGGAA